MARWRKSSFSDSAGNNCIELADLGDAVGMRDSKDPGGPTICLDRKELAALFKEARAASPTL